MDNSSLLSASFPLSSTPSKLDIALADENDFGGEELSSPISKRSRSSSSSASPITARLVTDNWPEEHNFGDSIFSDFILPDESQDAEVDQENQQEDENSNNPEQQDFRVQCTQRFLTDVHNHQLEEGQENLIHEELECSKYIYGSQYLAREDFKRCNELDIRNQSLKNEIQALPEINWCSQAFPDAPVLLAAASPVNTIRSRGPFYGLPQNAEHLIYRHKGIKCLYDWQNECLNLPAIANRKNLIYALPTSGGKTLVAEILILREIICREKNVLFILPYVSIVQEKVSSMSQFAINFDFLVEEYTAGKGRCPPQKRRKRKSVFIASIEKAAVLFDSLVEANRANEIGLVVVDEMHLVGERSRGHTLESLLTKVRFLKAGIQIVGMSATIGNLSEISEFLDADVYSRGFRPVELKEFIKCGHDLLTINSNEDLIENIFTHYRTVSYNYSEPVAKVDPDHLAGLVSEIAPDASVLIFCPTKKNCENVAITLSKTLPKQKYTEHRKTEKESLMCAIEQLCGTLAPNLRRTIPCGIAYHHSGLTTDERKILETAYRFGTISVICCTSTLAAGVNLPAKRVIIRAPYVGREFMSLCQYKQMAGRAGRAGFGAAGESILICSSKDNYKVGKMIFSPMDKVRSSLDYKNFVGLESLILSAIGLKIADCLKDLLELTALTLLSVQSKRLDVDLTREVTNMLRLMFKHKILQSPSAKTRPNGDNDMVTTQEINDNHSIVGKSSKHYVLSKKTKFDLTDIGRAAFKAGIDYRRAEGIYAELKEAQKYLSLRNFSHLLYLTTTYDEMFYPDPSIFYKNLTDSDEHTLRVAKVLGITEARIIKMKRSLSLKGPVEVQLYRMFKVLILNDVLNLTPVHEVAAKFSIERGTVQNLIMQSVSHGNGIIRLCEQLDDLWCFKPLLEQLCIKLDHCCIPELAPLLDLPSVKIGRAKQLYAAGYRTLEDIAKAKAKELVNNIEHLSNRVASEIISAARVILVNKLEILQEETEAILNCLKDPANGVA